MKKIIVLSFAVIAIALGFAFFATPANAVSCTVATQATACAKGEVCVDTVCVAASGANDTYGLGTIESTVTLGKKPLTETVAQLINVALSLLGIIAVVIILVGGFKWMTAGGNDEKTGEARKWIFSGIIGLAIIMSAWAITRFVFIQLQKATNSGVVPISDNQ